MSGRPLELRIYPPAPPEPEDNISLEWFAWHGDRSREQMLCEWKRLTDAELAAELWRAYAANGDGDNELSDRLDAWRQVEVWHRLATHPHYDET